MVDWEIRGCFPVPILHSALLIDIRRSITQDIAYTPPLPGYDGPYNDIIIFAHSVKAAAISMFILNTRYFGKVMVQLDSQYSLGEEIEQFAYLRIETMVEGPPLYRSKHVYVPPIPQSKLGFDEIYILHLLRRPERKTIMRNTLYGLGIDFIFFDASDEKNLNDTYLDSLGIKMLPGYRDPYHGRVLTMGEIGCFLSHYRIWEEIVSKNYEKSIIFEDDVRLELFYKRKLAKLMKEVEEFVPNWDLLYLGRTELDPDSEVKVKGSSTLIWPSYSYGSFGYILSRRGADKLLSHKPLHRMVPVDEYLPILFNKHPKEEWNIYFNPRNLVAVSADPLLLEPRTFMDENNYNSDTEDSPVIETDDNDTDNEDSEVDNTES
ncbi:procollagen galactosyltransferase 1-A isoform X2 [Patella vulgata]|nr:procollagen galactosyltransferase 1-A isoform X2 [Patella vulgata]